MTPLRQQYLKIKRKYPEAIVFFRLGDFYETFDQDAKVVSKELGIVLTSREMGKGQRIPMAGIPFHAVDNYLARLINRGHKVAICEQLSEPDGKDLVERDVIRVVTPGTVVEPGLLQGKANNYLMAMAVEGELAGIAYVDITTSEFATTQVAWGRAAAEVARLNPSEVLVSRDSGSNGLSLASPVTPLDEQWFQLDTARQLLLEHFGASSLEGYGCANLPLAIKAAGAIVYYLGQTQKGALGQLDRLFTYSTDSFMTLDPQTRRNMELFQTSRFSTAGSVLSVIDLTKTAMGGRLLKKWLGQPLLDIARLEQRLDAVDWFHGRVAPRTRVISLLDQIADLERLINRVRSNIVTPKEVVSLRRSLEVASKVREAIGEDAPALRQLLADLKPCQDVIDLISQAIAEEPPPGMGDGVIKEGFSPELDQIRHGAKDAKKYLANLERQERERTGIKSLKVGYNKVFGYYIEVSKPNLSQVPENYIRKQTLLGAERFFTPELKEYESLILNAQERTAELEGALFRQVCQQVAASAERILGVASALARIDVFCSLAEVAARYSYVRPKLSDDNTIVISGGRHPVVERMTEEPFVPNDTYLSNEDAQVIILTGPNMSGKSTYLRQVALIVLLAQIGSFVPADSASIGIVDRIFTRVGAQDELAMGRSTFMVEMEETANILNHATPRSLIILDEIGRGTSTYDGISIAQAVAEYIHNHPRLGAKTLFATHYHELVNMASYLPRVKNFNFAVAEEDGKVAFLRKILPGGADRSYGIHVAQLAGLPRSVIRRANEVLAELEGERQDKGKPKVRKGRVVPPQQLPLLSESSPLSEELAALDLDSLTPLEALNKLYELKKKAKGENDGK